MTDVARDPYRAYYDFEPTRRNFRKRGIPGSKRATVRHELGRAGSPCADLDGGTKLDIECPECGASGRVVGWDRRNNFYVCPDCDAVLSVSG